MPKNGSSWLVLVLVCGCQPAQPARGLRVEIRLGADTVELVDVRAVSAAPVALDEVGDLALSVTDAESGETLLDGRFADRRRAWEELSVEDPSSVPSGPILVDGALLTLVLPPPPSGRAQLAIELDTPGGERIERTIEIAAPQGGVAMRSEPLVVSGDVGARREAETEDVECPTEPQYNRWPGAPESPERTQYHGCARMHHLGGAEDPTDALLVVIYPGAGWSGDVAGFVNQAATMVASAMSQNEWFGEQADRLSFYAMADETAAEHTAISCSAGGLGESMNRMESEYWYWWRHHGAAYGPVPRGNSIEPDVYVALRNDYCDGWATDASYESRRGPAVATHILLGTTFGCFDTRTSSCPAGARLAHEMGHALGGLADAYYRCSTGSGTRYPNVQPRSSAEWSCYVGLDPALACPDHAPPVRGSYVRLYPEDGGCSWARPCGEDLMRGYYGSRFEFDPISAAAMTRALGEELGVALDDGLPACTGSGECVPACDAIDCGLDGCDGRCSCSCEGGTRSCETALSAGVCSGEPGCTRTRDLAAGQCSSTPRSQDLYVTATCTDAGWVATDCTTHTSVETCL